MKLHRLLLAVAAICILGSMVGEACADGFRGRAGFGSLGGGAFGGSLTGRSLRGGSFYLGRSPTSLYGLGRMFVPPHFAIHPPVYYSLPQARPYGHSPFAYSGDYHPPITVSPRIVRNPHIETIPLPESVEPPAETTTSTARVIVNPYYSFGISPETSLASQAE